MPPSPRRTVTVVIPVHDEAEYLPGAIAALYGELATVDAEIGVLVVENGSTDGSANIVRRLAPDHPGLRVIRLPSADYGAAMREGFLESDSDWVVNFDIDYFSGAFLAAALAESDADIVLGSKRAPGSDDRRATFRRIATWGFNLLLTLLFRSGVSDTHGMKAIRRHVVDDVVPSVEATQDLFDTELILRAERAGYRIVEIPVVVEELRQSRSGLLRRVPRTLRGLWRVRRSMAS